jgi:hypothetical protein
VQGKPPVWSPPSQAQPLRPDSGNFFRDPNAARFPQYPTEPAVQAVLTQNPDIDTGDIDIFACASTLGNLLRFVRNIDKPFYFNVELIGKTVFFIRKESSSTAVIKDVRGFGHTFPEAYTSWDLDVKRSISHYRVVKYNFAGLDCLVRFGCDGYYNELSTSSLLEPKSISATTASINKEFEELIVASDRTHHPLTSSNNKSSLMIKIAGQPIPQKAIFELKTKHGKYPIDMAEIYPRLWVCQVRNLLLAYHDKAVFSDIRKQDLHHAVGRWEDDNNKALCSLAVLMQKIVIFMKSSSRGKLQIVRNEGGNLEIREHADNGSDALPQTVKARWVSHMDDTSSQSISPKHGLYSEEKLADDGVKLDYTACAEDCGYCGRCDY